MEENSGSSSSSTPNWLTIPPELLTVIFDKLATLNIPLSERRNSILKCREVHPTWKSVMDSNLELRTLEFYTKWKPFNYKRENVYEFPRLGIVTIMEDNEREWVHIPLQIYNSYFSNTNPFFPTKSLTISHSDECNVREGNVLTKVEYILSKLGTHLTSLNFTTLEMPLKTLCEILSNTSNLKGLTLNGIDIRADEAEENQHIRTAVLPALGQLQTLRIFHTYTSPEEVQGNLYKLLLEPYSQQLVSIATDYHFGNLGLVFPSLKMLAVQRPEKELLELPPSTFPNLQYLSFEEFEEDESSETFFQNLHKFVSHFSKTLVELHLDVKGYHYWREDKLYDGGFNEKLVEGGAFPLLTKFSIYYPTLKPRPSNPIDPNSSRPNLELAVVKDMLRMFPNLEILTLLRFYFSSNFQSFSEDEKKHVKSYLENENYWAVCRKLKTIVVESGVYASPTFCTARPLI